MTRNRQGTPEENRVSLGLGLGFGLGLGLGMKSESKRGETRQK